ncbi:MAG: ABC transporter ATP-binding protein [Elusimicrobia bacterium]|nr:ABC transporter ATP-binding protein [Elusimicrobiota bacterium]
MARKGHSSLQNLSRLADRIGFDAATLVSPAVLGALAALFEAVSLGLLLPAAQASIQLDFGLVRRSKMLAPVLGTFPVFDGMPDRALYLILLAAIFAASMSKIILVYLSSVALARRAHALSSLLRRTLFGRAIGYGKLFFDHANAGHLQHIILGSPERIAAHLTSLQEIISAAFMLTAYAAVMLIISWKLTLALALSAPLIQVAVNAVAAGIKDASKRAVDVRKTLSSQAANVMTGVLLVKSCAAEPLERARFDRISAQLDVLQSKLDERAAMARPIQEGVFLVMMLALLLALAFIPDSQRAALIPGLLVFVYLARRASIALLSLGRFKVAAAAIEGSVIEALQLLDAAGKFEVPDGEKPYAGLGEGIRFQGLDYTFPNGVLALKGVSFIAPKGRMTAIVGPSGAGKTTLFNLLLRFYEPPSGAILLDQADIRGVSRASLCLRLALVDQDTILFNDTIRNNLGYAAPTPLSDEDLLKALDRARLSEFIRRLPQGLDTEIGDRGVKLSGGEKQRLSIARALLKNADILLLDEATSALDSETETLLQQSIETLTEGKTTLVIAHRLSTVKNADKIVVLEEGRVVEEGALEALLASPGPFRRLWEAQEFR